MQMWKESEIKALESQLNGYRAQLTLEMLGCLRQLGTESLSKQDNILHTLGIVSQQTSSLEGLGNSILEYLASRTEHTNGSQALVPILRHSLVKTIYEDGTAQEITIPEQRLRMVQRKILSALGYHELDDRQGRIAESYESTCEWIFRDEQPQGANWHSFKEWLQGDAQIYWITGKAGAGKSTLMKYLCQPVTNNSSSSDKDTRSRCIPYLRHWAGDKTLIVASFYFWISGTPLQKSCEGLLRSLLHRLLEEYPDAISKAFPIRWETMSMLDYNSRGWREPELHAALEIAIQAATSSKICFFIDGLDELQGGYNQLAVLIKDLAHKYTQVKFCVASRPWVEFQEAFGTNRMEDLTYNDLRHYISSNFTKHAKFPSLRERDPEFASQLVDEILSKASGVFLWVQLVVESLLSGISSGDRISDLRTRLECLPANLEDLYDQLLRSLDQFYLEHAAQLMMIMETAKEPLSLILMSFADEDNAQSVLNMTAGHQPPLPMIESKLQAMTRRLNSRCKGLVEVGRAGQMTDTMTHTQRTVQYHHRTVKDFIQRKRVQAFLRSALKPSFDPHMSLCTAYCANLKVFPLSDVPVAQVRICLWHAAKVSSNREDPMLLLLDDLQSTLWKIYDYPRKFTDDTSTKWSIDQQHKYITNQGHIMWKESYYLGTRWDAEIRDGHHSIHGSFGENFLSVVVANGVTAYVKARVHKGSCLAQKPYGLRSIIWPLLIDALRAASNLDMVQCLLTAGADPNYVIDKPVGGTPWGLFLQAHLSDLPKPTTNEDLKSMEVPAVYATIKAMLKHGASEQLMRDYTNGRNSGFLSKVWMSLLPTKAVRQLHHR